MDKKDRRYYQTKKWLAKRNAIMERAGGICEYCLLRPAYQVHHRTYARFKREDKSDLMAVCPLCHRYIHKLLVIGQVVDCRTGSLLERGDSGTEITKTWLEFLK